MKRSTEKQPQYQILSPDPWLKPYYNDISLRMQRHADTRQALLGDRADLASFANGYLYYGISRTEDGWVYREWAPGADALHLIGDFNGWNRESHPLKKLGNGDWEIVLPGEDQLMHGQRVKVQVTKGSETFDRIPLYIRRVVKDPETNEFAGQVWAPHRPFRWTDGGYGKRKLNPLFIYEAHIGMAQEDEQVGTYREFADRILDRVQEAGYNTIQLMAILEHPYYASFGYQVTNFFAASSWYGNPEDLKYLINTAHEMGMFVLLDIVHSHASKNTIEGINRFDGTDNQFFMKKDHPAWDTKLFNYAKHEVIHFLLSNLKFWLQEYHFDGFRFDGVTSMLYHDHGLGADFLRYDRYFSLNTNVEAVTYLQLANELIHAVNPFAVTIAEDMSGMPGMCLPIRYGGIGFDYRLSMGVPDFWIRALKDRSDEDWDMQKMWYELTTRRPEEKNIGYCESHDQALVGDKTLIFRMADREMYDGMDKAHHSVIIDRAMALHKMIRFITMALAGEGYLTSWAEFAIRSGSTSRARKRLGATKCAGASVALGQRISQISVAARLRPRDAEVRAQVPGALEARRGEFVDRPGEEAARVLEGRPDLRVQLPPDRVPDELLPADAHAGPGRVPRGVHDRRRGVRGRGPRQRRLRLRGEGPCRPRRGLPCLLSEPHRGRVPEA